MADWDADDFDPDADGKLTAPKVTDKWDGEDEDDARRSRQTPKCIGSLLVCCFCGCVESVNVIIHVKEKVAVRDNICCH